MRRLFVLLRDSAWLLSRNLVLLYPLLTFILLLSFLLPHTDTAPLMPSLELRWVLLGSVVFMLSAAFSAGWFNMMKVCIQVEHSTEWGADRTTESLSETTNNGANKPVLPSSSSSSSSLASAPDPRLGFTRTLNILKGFFPGVGAFFADFLVGSLLQIAALLLLVLSADHLSRDTQLLSPVLLGKLNHIMDTLSAQSAPATPDQVQALLAQLSYAEQNQLLQWMLLALGVLVAYGTFYILTMLWSAFIVTRQCSAFQAYGASIRQFFRDPLRLVFLFGFYLITQYAFIIGLPANNTFLLALWQFLALLNSILFMLLLVLYVMRYAPSAQSISASANHDPDNPAAPKHIDTLI